MATSSYVLAGFDGLTSVIEKFLTCSPEFNNHFTRQDVSNFFDRTCNKFLHSYGQNFRGKKKYTRYNEKEALLLKKCRESKFYNNSTFIVDSGAFQISVGILDRVQSHTLFNIYYDFLVDYCDTYDKAFILDLPPDPGARCFHHSMKFINLIWSHLKKRHYYQIMYEIKSFIFITSELLRFGKFVVSFWIQMICLINSSIMQLVELPLIWLEIWLFHVSSMFFHWFL